MTTEQTPTRPFSLRGTVAALITAAVIAVVGGAAIYAATGGAAQSFPRPPGGPPSAGMHALNVQPAGETALHGEFVMRDGTGGYTTVLSQTGIVTASSPASITVHSDDGYTQTYVIAQSAGPTPAVGTSVAVRATRAGQTSTVTAINAAS